MSPASRREILQTHLGALEVNKELEAVPYLPVIGLSPQHLRSHPESRAHQRQLPLRILHRQLHHLPGQPKVSHQCLVAPWRHSNEAVLKGAHGTWHEMATEEGPGHFIEEHLTGPRPNLAIVGSPFTRDLHPSSKKWTAQSRYGMNESHLKPGKVLGRSYSLNMIHILFSEGDLEILHVDPLQLWQDHSHSTSH